MKKLILILCIAFASCKKEDVKPIEPIIISGKILVNFEFNGFKNINTNGYYQSKIDDIKCFKIYLNGNLYIQNTYNYHIVAQKCDVIKFYFIDEIISDCNFVIWPDRNEQPDKMYFKPEYTFKVKNKTYGFIQGNYKVY